IVGLCRSLTSSCLVRPTVPGATDRSWCDRPFYEWLRGIGVTSAKSLTLGTLSVPDEYFADFFRRCIDGDGRSSSPPTVIRRRRMCTMSHSVWKLRYAKAESVRLLAWMYYAPDVPCLHRQRKKAERFLSPLGEAASGAATSRMAV